MLSSAAAIAATLRMSSSIQPATSLVMQRVMHNRSIHQHRRRLSSSTTSSSTSPASTIDSTMLHPAPKCGTSLSFPPLPKEQHAATMTKATVGTGAVKNSDTVKQTRNNNEDRSKFGKSIIDVIKESHATVKLLYEDYLISEHTKQKEAKANAIIAEMSRHFASQELVFYPFVRDALGDGRKLAIACDEDLTRVKTELKELDRLKLSDGPVFALQLSRVVEGFLSHADMDTRLLLNPLSKASSASVNRAALIEMGDAFQRASSFVAHRPHLIVPTEGIASAVSHTLMKPIDKIRDMIDGRGDEVDATIEGAKSKAARVSNMKDGDNNNVKLSTDSEDIVRAERGQ